MKEQQMGWIIFALLIGIPAAELYVLIGVGSEIGAFSTLMLCLLSAAIGLSLVRMQGVRVFQNMQAATQTGEPVGENLIHGFFLLLAGVCLFIPGFLTDFVGALLLVPFVRVILGKAGLARIVVKANFQTASGNDGGGPHNGPGMHSGGVTIDGEFTTKNEDEKNFNSENISSKKNADSARNDEKTK
ncbi:MAG: hypothetical protein COB37_09440 [Kordiimonadales bacterium]|nr:MAG: hypothetical protein COB37_09440 [Kordiimonadales bacterium]